LGRLREEYVNTGKVHFVYMQYPILGQESVRAAEATECAAEQDKFWPLHDTLFEDMYADHSSYTDDKLIEFAKKIELDVETFSSCLASGRYSDLISQDRASIQELGVRGTPAFLINGIYLSGAQPYEVFQEVIEEQLKQASEG
jgi:protein-disulfide isomerase